MENKFYNKFNEPVFRKEAYEYLLSKVDDRIKVLEEDPKAMPSGDEIGFTGYMCINLKIKFESIYKDVEFTGAAGFFNSLNRVLPELIRPPELPASKNAWFYDDIPNNLERRELLIKALKLLEEVMDEK